MKRYTKEDVEFHSDKPFFKEQPAVNVKVYHWPVSEYDIMDKFNCSEETAKQANEFAWTSACEQFWENIQVIAEEIFGKGVKIYSQGRSGGWAVVDGLPPFNTWDAIMLGKWRRFEKAAKTLPTKEEILEDIEMNKRYIEGAEQYNFFTKDGEDKCIAEEKQKAIDAGFGPIIR